MRNKTLKYLYWVLACTVLVIFLVGLAAFRNLQQAQDYSRLVSHTTEVLLQVEETFSQIKDAETGVRGYLLTYDSRFLEPYSQSVISMPLLIRSLDSMTFDNERQRAPMRRLDSLTRQRFEIMKQSISISVSTSARDSLRANMVHGRLVMDSIRTVVKQIRQEERRLLADREKKASEFSALNPLWLGFISLLAVVLFSASFFVVILELRRRWRYETELKQAVNDLRKTNAELENFVYLTSHHLQEPLRKLQTFNGRLKSKFQAELPEEAVYILGRISDSAARMQQLMDDLLLYLRFGSPTRPVDFEPVVLTDLLNGILQTLPRHSGQAPDLRLETSDAPEVVGIPGQLRALFEQLLDNSLKFARQNVKPVIKIRTFVTHGSAISELPANQSNRKFCKIELSDNGIGFDTVYKGKIFQLFQRLHHRHEYPGTGIGLAICQKIVANHHGYVDVDSRLGEGTTFHIYLPLADGIEAKI